MTDPATQSPTTLRIERAYEHPAQAVFDAWTNPEVMRRWWHAEPNWDTPHAEADLRLGGKIRVVMRTPDGKEFGGSGEYTEIRPPERLAFTWTWDDDPEGRQSLIEVDFTEQGGATTVALTHSGLRDEESRDSHIEGWENCLENLALKGLGEARKGLGR
jgi:uncharacterized protein YndB with AHSA1/START domain